MTKAISQDIRLDEFGVDIQNCNDPNPVLRFCLFVFVSLILLSNAT